MIKEVWRSFPHILEKKINGLLDHADPKPLKAFHLFKTCQREEIWDGTFETFLEKLVDFYHTPRRDRRKSQLDVIFLRPLQAHLFDDFRLNFRTAEIANEAIGNVALWASEIIRLNKRTNSAIYSKEILAQTIRKIASPTENQKDDNIDFEDFCDAWNQVVFKEFGSTLKKDLVELIRELRLLKSKIESEPSTSGHFVPLIYLTQTEIDWVQAIVKALTFDKDIPAFPLSRGPQKQRLADLDRAVKLYRIVQSTKLKELLIHRQTIRKTIFSLCQSLLNERAR